MSIVTHSVDSMGFRSITVHISRAGPKSNRDAASMMVKTEVTDPGYL